MIVKTPKYSHLKKIFFVLTTLLLVIGFTAFLVKNKGFKTLAYSPELFVTRWQTNVAGATDPTKITLNFQPLSGTAYYEVSWKCDDNFEVIYNAKHTHDYGTAGTYDVCIRTLTPLAFYAPDLTTEEKGKLLEIKQWGSIKWSSFTSAFKGMTNMQLTATDTPDLSQVTDMSSAFEGATSFTGHESMNSWNTSGVTNMSTTFGGASNFNAPIGNWDTSAVTNMNSMFYGATNFNQYIGTWQTGTVANMAYMFFEAANFNNGEAPGASTKPLEWNTSSVTNMKQMFNKASSFNQDINNWQTGLVRDMYAMFAGATVFNQNIGSWNTSEVVNMGSMFTQAYAFNQDISNWQTGKATSMTSMFKQATAFNQNIGSWNTGNVTNMSYMFDGATNFNNGDAPGVSNSPLGLNTSKVINMRQMFGSASSFNQDIGSWQTGTVKDMYFMFSSATAFNQDIGGWNTGNVTNMGGMFARASAFNQDIGNWQTGNVTNMASMFLEASAFNQDIGSWQTGKVQYMQSMFQKATAFNNGEAPGESHHTMNWDTKNVGSMANMFSWASSFNQNIGNWNTGMVTSMASMFRNATAFNNGDAPGESQHTMNWDTKNVTSMTSMFQDVKVFNQNIGSWDTSKVSTMAYLFSGATAFNNGDAPGESHHTMNWSSGSLENMSYMFYRAETFNQPFGNNWNTASVTNMSYVFRDAKRFNQNISNWQTGNVTDMSYMFNYATAFNQPIGGWDTSKVTNMMYMFNNATSFDQDISDWNISKVERISYFLNNTDMHPYNYDALLTDWSAQTVKPNLYMDAVGVYYCHAQPARDVLTSPPKNWRINDAGQKCPPQNLTLSNTEIEEDRTEVGTISVTAEGTVIYSLVSGEGSEDNSKFTLNSTTGILAFLEAPDYENPQDLGDTPNNNTYSIRVKATDTANFSIEQAFIITVLDVDDVPPEITINQVTTMSSGYITDTTFTVSDRFSIESVQVDASSVATADHIVCTPAFPYENPAPSPENHIEMNCTIRIKTSGKLVLKATDKAGHSSTASKDGYVVDMVAPTFITSNVDTETNGLHRPIVSFEAFDSVGVAKYEIVYIKDNEDEGVSSTETIDEIAYTPGVIERTLNLDPHELQHTIKVIAYDLVGNTVLKQTVFPPEIVFNAPTVISNQPIDDTTVTITTPISGHKIGNIVISGSASAGATLGTCTDINNNTTAPYDTTVTCQILGIQKTGMIMVTAQDITNGATGYETQMYTYDTTPPIIAIHAPTKAKKDNITDTTITIRDLVEIYPTGIEIAASSAGMAQNLVCTADSGDKKIINCTVTIIESGNLVIKATDRAGNSITKTEANYIVDRIPPQITITSTAPINRANRTRYTLGGTCTFGDNNIITVIAQQPYTAECLANGTWSTELDLSTQPDGTVIVKASQTDAVGNKGEDTKELTKDTVAPIVGYEILSTNVPSPKLTGTINDKNATVTVKIEQTGQVITATNNQNGTWTLPAGEITGLTTNTYDLTITATDPVGNSNEITDQLFIDSTPPYITSITPATGQQNPTNQQPIIFHATFSEPLKDDILPPEGFKIKENGVIMTAQVTNITRLSSTKYALSVSEIVSQKANITIFSPAHTYQDVLENWNTVEVESSPVTFDKEKPNVTVEERKPNSSYLDPTNLLNNPDDTDFRFNVVFSKPINTDTLSIEDFSITGGTYTDAQLSVVDNSNAIVIFKPTQNATYKVILPAGRVSDLVGNLNNPSTSVDNQRTYDTTPPTITITSPTKAKKDNITDTTITITDTFGIDVNKIEIDTSTTATTQDFVCTLENDNTVNCTVTITESGNLVIKSTDKAGNSTTKNEDNYIVDRTAPVVTITSTTPINNTNQTHYTLTGTCTAGDGDITITIGTQTYSTTCQADKTWSTNIDLSALEDGTISIQASQTDAVGNTGNDSKDIFKDTISPTVTVNQADDQIDPTNEDIIKFTIVFSKAINGDTFTRDDLLISGSSTAKVLLLTKINDTTYTAFVNGILSGETVSLTLPAEKVQDLAGNKNSTSTSTDNSVTYDNTAPTVTINQSSTQPDPTNINSVKYTVIFSEPIKEDTFTNEDILISGSSTAKVKSITKISETKYEVEIENLTSGETVTATIPADVLTDLAGNKNIASTSTDNSVTYAVEGEEEEDDETPPTQEPETPTTPVITTPLDPKPVVKPKNPFDKYINPVIEQEETTTPTKEDSSDRTSKTTPPTQSKSLRIKVYNESREPIKGVTVEIHSDVRTGITDENGEVYFENLETGLHTMIISYNGYRAEKEIKLINDGEEEMEINIKLEKVIIPNYVYWLIALIVLLTILLGYNIYKRKQVEKK